MNPVADGPISETLAQTPEPPSAITPANSTKSARRDACGDEAEVEGAADAARDVMPPGTLNVCLGQTAEVHVGFPIDASSYSLEGREQLMATVEKEIRRLAEL